MKTIYDNFDIAFSQVSAFVILNDKAEKIATVTFKFPKDGAGRLQCYFHACTLPMVKGVAGGYGYDKKTAAFADAIKKALKVKIDDWQSASC